MKDSHELNLGSLLLATDPEGRPLYTRIQAEDFIATILIARGFKPGELPIEFVELLTHFAIRVSVNPKGTQNEIDASLARYFARNPIPKGLKRGVGRQIRAAMLLQDPKGVTEALASIGVEVPRTTKAPSLDAEPPEGTIGRGILGYFSAKKKLKK